MTQAPKHDRHHRHNGDEPLDPGEFIFHRADGNDGGVSPWLEGDEEEKPDEEDGDDADGEGDEEPDAPPRLRRHVL